MSISSIASRHSLVVARRSAERGATLNLLELTQNQLDSMFYSSLGKFDKARRESNGDIVASFFVDGDPEATWTANIQFVSKPSWKPVITADVGELIVAIVKVTVIFEKQYVEDSDQETLSSELPFRVTVPSSLSAFAAKARKAKFVDKTVDSIDLDRSRLLNS